MPCLPALNKFHKHVLFAGQLAPIYCSLAGFHGPTDHELRCSDRSSSQSAVNVHFPSLRAVQPTCIKKAGGYEMQNPQKNSWALKPPNQPVQNTKCPLRASQICILSKYFFLSWFFKICPNLFKTPLLRVKCCHFYEIVLFCVQNSKRHISWN